MKIVDLKNNLINNKLNNDIIIFVTGDNSTFLSNQYIENIALIKKQNIIYLKELPTHVDSFLDDEDIEDELRIFKTDDFEVTNNLDLLGEKNLIIVCNKISYVKGLSKDIISLYDAYTVKMPVLEDWQVIDYIMSCAEGIDDKQASWLYKSCGGNIDKIDQELNKLKCFSKSELPTLFTVFANDKVFNSIPNINVFSFSHALSVKNIDELTQVFYNIEFLYPNISTDCMKVIGLLYKEFKNLTLYQTSRCPTPENTGIPSKQFWVYEKKTKKYNINQLIKIFELLSDMDRRIKNGEFPNDIISIADYLTIKILNA